MGRLKVRVGLVPGITVAIAGQIGGLRHRMGAHAFAGVGLFVDVVPEEQHQVRRLGGQGGVGGKVAGGILLAGGESELQPVHRDARGRGGARAPHGAGMPAGDEAIPVHAPRSQAAHLDVHRVPGFGPRECPATDDDALQPLVLGDLPANGHRRGRHPAANLPGLGHQPGPQHHAVRGGLTRRHAQAERIVRHPGLGHGGGPCAGGQRQSRQTRRLGQQASAVDHHFADTPMA